MNLSEYCTNDVGELDDRYRHWFLIPAIIITLSLALLEKRRGVKPHLFGGRPAVVSPFSIIDEPSNRYGIMLVIGSVTGSIITGTVSLLAGNRNVFGVEFPLWAKIFWLYLSSLEFSVICYPLFACMTTRHKLVGSITGLLYAIGWFIFEMFVTVQFLRCYHEFTILGTIGEMPIILCNFLLIPKFCFKLYKCWRKGIYVSKNEVALCKRFHLTYVKYLLQKHRIDSSNTKGMTLKQKIQSKVMNPVPGFRFPITIMISTFMAFIMLYMVILFWVQVTDAYIRLLIANRLDKFQDILQVSTGIAVTITIVCGISNTYIFLTNYRRDMLLLYKGDRSFIPSTVQTPSPHVYMAQGMRFIGTSVTGMIYGTVFVFLLVFLPLTFTMIVIRELNTLGKLDRIWDQFQWLVYPVSAIFIFRLQIFLIGRFFIQSKLNPADKYRPFALDNRKVYHVFSFFMIFLNASIGVFAFLKRILLSAFLGVFLVSRMDRCLLMSGFETMDNCYVNYIGMIMVDEAHNHPVLRVFSWLVKENADNRRDRKPLNSAVDNPVYGHVGFSPEIPVESGTSLAKRRWWLAYTLVRNPNLTVLRIRDIRRIENNDSVELNEIECSNEYVDTQDVADVSKCSFRFCNDFKCTIPPNIIINVMALMVLLCLVILYAGLSTIFS